MNTFIYTKALKMKSLNYLTFPAILAFFLLSGWQNTQASYSDEQKNTTHLALDTLVHTEEAIALLRINPELAKNKIEHALGRINEISAYYTHNTVVALESQGKSVMVDPYLHYLPKIDLSLLENQNQLPTLKYKLDADIVYRGNIVNPPSANNLYFDYSFAKASLLTAREALNANHSLEAMANLRRTFEAIYIDPAFNVSAVN